MADTRVDPNPPHACPGGCGESVPHNKLACRSCWWHLPEDMRGAITNARGGNRLAAVGEGARWLREHLVDGRFPDQGMPGHLTITIDESWRPRNG